MNNKNFSVERLSYYRKAVRASATITKRKNAIHYMTEVEISNIRTAIDNYYKKNGIKLSFTAYLVKCFSQLIENNPEVNCFVSGNRIIKLNDIVISVLVEKSSENEKIPEPSGIQMCQKKNCLEISNEIRDLQKKNEIEFKKNIWILNIIPGFLLKLFIQIADSSPKMALKYGKFAITSVGMFAPENTWVLPHGTATILLTVGSFVKKAVLVDQQYKEREFLCLTISYDHDIIDGAPAARLTKELTDIIRKGSLISDLK